MSFIGRTKDVKVRQQKFRGDGTRKIFTLDWIPLSDNQLSVYMSGIYLNDKDFVYKHPNKILFSQAPDTDVEVIVSGLKVSDFQSVRHKTYKADGTQRIFDCGFIPPEENALMVTVNGDVMQDRDFVIDGHKVILNNIPSLNSVVEIRGIHDIIDPSGNVLASNNLSINRTRATADGLQNIHAIHQKPLQENNLITIYGTSAFDGKVSNQQEYALINEYKFVNYSPIIEGTEIEFRGLTGSKYSNLNRRVMMSKEQNGIPNAVSLTTGGTSGYTNDTIRAVGGSGTEIYITITTSGGVVTGVALPSSGWTQVHNFFSTDFQNNEVLTLQQSGSTNDATITITGVTDNNAQRYFDINNYRYDGLTNGWTADTTYQLPGPGDEKKLLVTVDGIIQPYNQYSILQTKFTPYDTGIISNVVDIGTFIEVNDQASIIEIRDIGKLIANDDTVIDADTGIERIVWTTQGASATFNVTSGYDARSSNFATAFNGDVANKQKFMVMVNGVVQDVDTWTLATNTLTIGATIGHADDAVTGAHIRVEMIYFTSLDSSCQDAYQYDMTGNFVTGAGDHKFIRMYDRATVSKELVADSDASAVVVIDGVLQNDHSYFFLNSKLCFFDEAPDPGSIINVKMLKCSEIAATDRRKAFVRGNGSDTQFTLPFSSTTTPDDFGILVTLNGKMIRDDQFSLNGTTLTFNTAPANDAFIEIMGIFDTTTYAGASADTNLETKKTSFICDGQQQIFDLHELIFEKHAYGTIQDTYNEQKLLVYLDGELKTQTEYMIVGNKVYLTDIPVIDTVLEVVRFI
jgi:hypothetical protein